MNQRNKIMLYVSLSLFIMIGSAVLYLQNVLPGKLTRQLKNEISRQLNTNSATLYDIHVEPVRLRLRSPQVFIPFIGIEPKDHLFSDALPDSLPQFIIQTKIRDFGISANGIISVVRNKKDILFKKISLSVESLTLFSNAEGKNEKKNNDAIASEGSYGTLDLQIHIERFTYKPLSDTLKVLAEVTDMHIAGGFAHRISSDTLLSAWQFSDYILIIESANYFPDEDLYSYHAENIFASAAGQELNLSSAKVKPRYDKKEFQLHTPYQVDRMDVQIDKIALSGFDPNELINQKTLNLSRIIVNNAHLGVFRDRNLPLDTITRPLMPVKLMRSAPLMFHIPEIKLNTIDVIYSELAENGTIEGTVPITGINATITNFTNNNDSLHSDSIMRINAGGIFFEQAQLQASFEYNLMDINGGYRAKGSLSELDFKQLNMVLMPLLNIKVEKGTHDKTTFQFSGNDTHSAGTITMHYKDLGLILEPDRSRIRQSVTSWAGRNIVYHTANPGRNEEIREGIIDFERDPLRFVFHYWWNCYLTGIKSTLLRDHIDL